jgi:hypothetical protein
LDIRRGGFLPRKKRTSALKLKRLKREAAEQKLSDQDRRDLGHSENPQTAIDIGGFGDLKDDTDSPANDVAAFFDSHLDAEEEPPAWIHHFICVIDPFIRQKVGSLTS